MSRFTQFIHEHFGTGVAGETAADIILRFIPDSGTLGTVKEIAADAVAVIEGTGISGEEKKKLVTAAVTYALAAMKLSVPASVVSFLIEEAVLLLKGGKPSAPPIAPPPPDPTLARYPTKEAAIAAAAVAGQPNVLLYPNGEYGVYNAQWPMPHGAVVVYP